jgi:hypothetical protein
MEEKSKEFLEKGAEVYARRRNVWERSSEIRRARDDRAIGRDQIGCDCVSRAVIGPELFRNAPVVAALPFSPPTPRKPASDRASAASRPS